MYRRCTKHVQKMYNIFRILIEVPDYSSSSFFFSRNEEEAIPPGGKKYLGTRKGSTRMILLVHIQKMYNIFRKLVGVWSSGLQQ